VPPQRVRGTKVTARRVSQLCLIEGVIKKVMALQLKSLCERCGQGISVEDKAYICIYECTFCHACTLWMGFTCPNCGGELVRRPRRKGTGVRDDSKSAEADCCGVLVDD
jgi:uncharacterized protein